MTTGEALYLIVPCYNEARRLDTEAFTSALAMYPWMSLVFVNDGSTDSTGEVLSRLESRNPERISILTLATNVGKAEAVRQGILLVASESEGMCGFWDADLSAPLSELEKLRELFNQNPEIEWVWGIRLRALGRKVVRKPLRHYLGRLFATVSSLLLGIESYDTQCGAKLFKISPLLKMVVSEPFRSRWIFDVEMLVRAKQVLAFTGDHAIDAVVYEEPLSTWQHSSGSKVQGGDFLKALHELWLIRRSRGKWNRSLKIN